MVRTIRQTLSVLVPFVLGGSIVAIAGMAAVRSLVPQASLARSNDVLGNYMQTLGGIYAVLLAFVVFVVWQQFNETRARIELEANEILDLMRAAQGLPAPQRTRIQERMTRYVDGVLEEEWLALAQNDEAVLERGGVYLDETWEELHCLEPTTICQQALHQEALTRFNDLSDARSLRLTTSRVRIPRALRLLIYVGAVMLVASTWLLAVESFTIHAFISGGLGGAVSHVIYVIEDLDECFRGDWQVSRAPFERVRRYLRARVAAG